MKNLREITPSRRTTNRGRKSTIPNGQRVFAYISEPQLEFLNKFGAAVEANSLSEALRALLDDVMAQTEDIV